MNDKNHKSVRGVRVDVHKNAKLTLKGREELVRLIAQQGLSDRRVTGNRRQDSRGAGWEYAHVAVVDHSRVTTGPAPIRSPVLAASRCETNHASALDTAKSAAPTPLAPPQGVRLAF